MRIHAKVDSSVHICESTYSNDNLVETAKSIFDDTDCTFEYIKANVLDD